jgi:hypothetical protein
MLVCFLLVLKGFFCPFFIAHLNNIIEQTLIQIKSGIKKIYIWNQNQNRT